MAKKSFIKTNDDLTGAMASSGNSTSSPIERPVSNELTKAIEMLKIAVSGPTAEPKKKSKKETAKGTISVNAMIEGSLYSKGKIKAFMEKRTFSNILNDALRIYLNE